MISNNKCTHETWALNYGHGIRYEVVQSFENTLYDERCTMYEITRIFIWNHHLEYPKNWTKKVHLPYQVPSIPSASVVDGSTKKSVEGRIYWEHQLITKPIILFFIPA